MSSTVSALRRIRCSPAGGCFPSELANSPPGPWLCGAKALRRYGASHACAGRMAGLNSGGELSDHQRRMQALAALGRCAGPCKEPWDGGPDDPYCPGCKERRRQQRKRVRGRRIEAGLCTECGMRPPLPRPQLLRPLPGESVPRLQAALLPAQARTALRLLRKESRPGVADHLHALPRAQVRTPAAYPLERQAGRSRIGERYEIR